MANQANQANQADQESHRKPYSSPVVHDYGNIRAITKVVGNTPQANRDSAAGTDNKTR